MIIRNGKRYYPVELVSIYSGNGRVVYDREIWQLRCPLLESNRAELTDLYGDIIVLGRYAAYGIAEYVSAFTGEEIDDFIREVLL